MVELVIGIFVGLVVILGAGALYLATARSFNLGARKLRAQQEATILSTVINRRIRVGSSYEIYNVPNRAVPADSGDGLALRDKTGALMGRLEWDGTAATIVDSTGTRVTVLTLQDVKFKRDPATTGTVRYRFTAEDGRGNLVHIQSAATLRN